AFQFANLILPFSLDSGHGTFLRGCSVLCKPQKKPGAEQTAPGGKKQCKSDEVDQAALLGDAGHILVLVEGIEVDAVDAAGTVLVDLVDGVLDAGLLEIGLLLGSVGVEGLLVEGVGEDPVLGDDLAEFPGHDAAVAAESHVDGSSLVQD